MNYLVCRKARIFALPLLAFAAAGMFAADAHGQLFRRYSQPAYTPYQPSYATAAQSSCTCQQQARMAQQSPYQAQPAVRYAVYYNPQTNQTYLRPVNVVTNPQISPAPATQVDVARQTPSRQNPSVLNRAAINTPPAIQPRAVSVPASSVAQQPALTQPVAVEPALSSPVPTDPVIEPAATFTSQPNLQDTNPRNVDVETNQEAPTPAPAKTENEKKSFSVLESTSGSN